MCLLTAGVACSAVLAEDCAPICRRAAHSQAQVCKGLLNGTEAGQQEQIK